MQEATLSSKNQMVLPKKAREHLGVKSGDKVMVVCRRNGTVTLAANGSVPRALRGSAKGAYGDVEKYMRRERESWGS
jgi:AbrB family looped-hinge helix DNA binding protein